MYNKGKEEEMNKEEIFEKAKKDYDEMELAICTKALGISTIIIPIFCTICIIIRIISSQYIISDLVAITLSQLSISQIYQAIKTKKVSLFVTGTITFTLTVFFLCSFIKEVTI